MGRLVRQGSKLIYPTPNQFVTCRQPHFRKTRKLMASTQPVNLDPRHSTTRRLFSNATAAKMAPRRTGSFAHDDMQSEGGLRVQGLIKQSGEKLPLISIITVVYNGASELARTIESVLRLDYDNIEYIVVDGNSNDGTCEVLRHYETAIDYWCSEPDSGIYDAMNKGIELATGDFVYHLNIGDRVLRIPIEALIKLPASGVCLACRVQLGSGLIFSSASGMNLRYRNTIHHQGCFYRRSPQFRYSTTYKVFSDFDLNQRLKKSGRVIAVSSVIVAEHDSGGASHQRSHFSEVFQIVNTNYGPLWVAVCFLYFKLSGLRHRIGLA